MGNTHMHVRCGFIRPMALPLLAATKTLRIPFETSALGADPPIVTGFEVPMYDGDLSSRIRISPLLIYAVEGYRLENQATPLAMPLLLTTAMQTQALPICHVSATWAGVWYWREAKNASVCV
ncbi:uncharacterized protein BKA55DRAFT_687168 [Fusarium redolens]|uniref:Uncharacterized protein n=1 Tax=Fusarium redolens TaxID=48865 RepID=A0A9P9HJL9_FUSRE|nr:uncharacterized protein BKA55DRAFT_687168 [Fusarium redolens]KAH7258873.1 hypothetical protein BKA55DRAFT_687168 [Fusarium redolens]